MHGTSVKSLRNLIALCFVGTVAPASAWNVHGVPSAHVAVQQTVQNFQGISSDAFINLAHSLSGGSTLVGWPGVLTSNGYPTSGLTQQIGGNTLALIPNYYGHYQLWWSGSGSFQTSSATIIYSGGTGTQINTASGSVTGNLVFGAAGASTQPSSGSPVEWAIGALVSAVADGGSCTGGTAGLVCLTSNAIGNFATGNTAQINFVNNLPSGPYTITKLDSTHIQLQGSTFSGTMSINSGAPGTQSEAIFASSSQTWAFPVQGGTVNYSSMDNLVICRVSDCANVGSHYVNPDYVNALKAPNLNPRWVRFMDMESVQGSFATSFAGRPTTAQLVWGARNFVPGYWSGLLTNGGADNYTTASNPSLSPASGPPVDGEIVEGYIGAANTTTVPTLAVTRTGFGAAKKILGFSVAGLSTFFSGSLPATGVTISLVFTGGGLSSPFTYVYGPNSNATNTFVGGTGGVSSSTMTIASVSAGAVTIGQLLTGSGISGSLQVIGNSITNSGLCSPNCTGSGAAGTYALSKAVTVSAATTITGAAPALVADTTFGNIIFNLRSDINSGLAGGNAAALSAAHIVAENQEVGSQLTFGYNPNINSSGVAALGNGLTITGTDSSSTGTYVIGYVTTGYLPLSHNITFTYSAIADGWIAVDAGNSGSSFFNTGPQGGPPLEFYEDLCTQAGTGMWFNVPILYSDSAVSSTVTHIANAGVKELVLEISNETWNSGGGGQWHIFNSLGQNYGFSSSFNGGTADDALTGLRTIQIASAARTAWAAAGRSQSQLFIADPYQFVSASGSVSQRFNGGALNPGSNVTLAAYGGSPSNGTATPTAWATNSSAFPNRPADWSDFVSPAVYFQGVAFNTSFGGALQTGTGINLASYNCSLVASYNYVNGAPTDQQTALDFMFNGTSGDFYTLTGLGSHAINNNFQLAAWAHGSGTGVANYFGITTIVAAYDAARTGTNPHTGLPWQPLGVGGYEGDAQAGPVTGSDTTTIATSLTNLGDTSGYTSGLGSSCGMTPVVGGPTSTPASDATNMQILLNGNGTTLGGFKNDNRYKLLYLKYFSDFQAAVTSQGNRIAVPATYGLEGSVIPGGGAWAKYPGSIYTTPLQSWNAIQSINN